MECESKVDGAEKRMWRDMGLISIDNIQIDWLEVSKVESKYA